MFLSLLEMAELQGCSRCSENIESGEPDIHTLKEEIKSLVKYNRKLSMKTLHVTDLFKKITNKAGDLRTRRSAIIVQFQIN